MAGKNWVALGALAAGIAVAAGAFGAHYLKDKLEADQLATFEVAVRYQMYHGLALILVGLFVPRQPGRLIGAAGFAFLLGILGFSGGLYVWLASEQRWLMAIVPLGGTTWIVGWALLAIGAWQIKASPARPAREYTAAEDLVGQAR